MYPKSTIITVNRFLVLVDTFFTNSTWELIFSFKFILFLLDYNFKFVTALLMMSQRSRDLEKLGAGLVSGFTI